MKKRHSIHLLLAAAALLLAMAACTKDELADGDRLPEGQYPLEIARITLGVEGGEAQPWGAPATRVSETVDGTGSVFDTGDPFTVQIDDGTETATYTVQGDDTATSDAPLYWTNTTPNRTVSAWYPATDGTLDLGNQSQSLVYLLSGTGTGDYQTPVTLNFTHQLAKVRVTPKADALGEVTSLQLYTYTQCTYEKGKAGQGSQEGWIEMKKCEYTENGATITCWEANVVPGYEIKKLRANGTEERDLSSAFTPEASKFYNITLDKDKGYNLSTDGRTYEVYNADGLLAWNEAARNDLSINCTLTDNIDLTGKEWTPIGDYDNRYTGTFDGGNHTITGLTINQYGSYVGMIDFLDSGGTVQNLTLENVNITGGNIVGSVVGDNHGTVTACYHVSGNVSGTYSIGGVAGENNGTMTACYHASGNVSGTSGIGGVVGTNKSGTLTACYATGNVTGNGSGTIYVGGVTGTNKSGTLTACYHANGTVSGPAGTTGGVVGYNNDTVTACYWGSNPDTGIGYNEGGSTTIETTKVTDGNWTNAVTQMNAALQNAGSEWRYELTGALPTLKKQ